MTKVIVNQEADEVLYRSAFAVERTAWVLTTNSGKSRDFGTKYTKTKLVNMLKERGKIESIDYTLSSYKIAEPFSHCVLIVKNTLKKLAKHGEVKLWLSPSDNSNFRYGITTIEGPRGFGYKANRPPRPTHYAELRKYLMEVHGAEEATGYEADDMLSMYQTETSIASHIDKDISMVPGWHLNWVTGEKYFCPYDLGTIELNEKRKVIGRGLKFFYHQLLTGDATDNIAGVPGFGPISAFKVLGDCTTEDECRDVVNSIYLAKFGDGYETRLAEIADLLWMIRADRKTGREYLGLK